MANHDIVDVAGALKTYVDTKTLANLADVESTSTASKAYAVGDHLVYNGVLYKVTAAIASGATLVPNTNIESAQVENEIDETEDQINAIVNLYGSKNLFKPYKDSNSDNTGVSYATNADGSLAFSGTASETSPVFLSNDWQYIADSFIGINNLKGKSVTVSIDVTNLPAGHDGNILVFETGNLEGSEHVKTLVMIIGATDLDANGHAEKTVTIPNDSQTNQFELSVVTKGNVNYDGMVLKVMIRDARIKDSTYEPFCYTNKQLTGMIEADYGAGVNLLEHPFSDPMSLTLNGITFVDNKDGTIFVNGRNTYTDTRFHYVYQGNKLERGKSYVLSLETTGTVSGTFEAQIALWNGSTYTGILFRATPNSKTEFTMPTDIEYTSYAVYLICGDDADLTNVTAKTMICPSNIKTSGFISNIMKNSEITDFIKYMGGALDRTRQPGVSFSDLSFSELVNKEPGMYCVPTGASNEPDSDLNSGSYGNLLLFPMKCDNRNFGILAFDNGNVYLAYGYGPTQLWKCISCHMETSVQANQTYFNSDQYVIFSRKGEVVTLGIGISPKVSIPVGTYDLCDIPSRYRFDFGPSNTALMNIYQVNGTVSAFVDSTSQKVKLQVGVAAANNASFIRGTMVWFTNQ